MLVNTTPIICHRSRPFCCALQPVADLGHAPISYPGIGTIFEGIAKWVLPNITVPTILAEVKVSPVVPSPSRSTPKVVCVYKKSAVLSTVPLVRASLLLSTHLAKVPLVFFQPHQPDCRRASYDAEALALEVCW